MRDDENGEMHEAISALFEDFEKAKADLEKWKDSLEQEIKRLTATSTATAATGPQSAAQPGKPYRRTRSGSAKTSTAS